MNARQMLNAVVDALKQQPPRGLEPADIEGFVRRNRVGLEAVIQHHIEHLCRPDRLLAGYELRLGEAYLPVQNQGQVSVFGRDVGVSPRVLLAVKARCLPLDPVQARQYAVHSRREDEQTWRIHEGEDWHAREWDAIRAFVEGHVAEVRWLERDPDDGEPVEEGGNPAGPILLTLESAWELARELLEEQRFEAPRRVKTTARGGAGRSQKGKKGAGTGLTRAAARGAVERLAENSVPPDPPELGSIIPKLVAGGGLRPAVLRHLTPSERAKAKAIPGLIRAEGMTLLQAARAHFGPGHQVVSRAVSWEERAGGLESTQGFLEDLDWALSELGVEALERLCGCQRKELEVRPDMGVPAAETERRGKRQGR